MKAAVIDRYGGNDVVHLRDVPLPVPGRGDVLIRVHAASINPVDWKVRSGMVKILTGWRFPKTLGGECAGEVAVTGPSVTRFRRGDEVIGFPGIRRLGAFAEYVVVSERTTFVKPRNVPFEQASTIPIAGITALQALRDLSRIEPGKKVLINGATGGVGHFAVQLAKILGGHVTAVCSGPKADFIRSLGANEVIDYAREDFTKGGGRYDIVFDAVSKRTFGECRQILSPRGVYVNTLPSLSVLLNQYLLRFLTGQRAATVMVRPTAADMEWMRARIEEERIRIAIDRVYPLEQIREAFAYSETGRATGKIVLRI